MSPCPSGWYQILKIWPLAHGLQYLKSIHGNIAQDVEQLIFSAKPGIQSLNHTVYSVCMATAWSRDQNKLLAAAILSSCICAGAPVPWSKNDKQNQRSVCMILQASICQWNICADGSYLKHRHVQLLLRG